MLACITLAFPFTQQVLLENRVVDTGQSISEYAGETMIIDNVVVKDGGSAIISSGSRILIKRNFKIAGTFKAQIKKVISIDLNLSITEGTFHSPITIDLSYLSPVRVYYTLDGSTPDLNSTNSMTPFSLDLKQTTTFRYFAINSSGQISYLQSQTYTIQYADLDVDNDGNGDIQNYLPGYTLYDEPVGNENQLYQDVSLLFSEAYASDLTVKLSNTSKTKGFANNSHAKGDFEATKNDFVLRHSGRNSQSVYGLTTDAFGVLQNVRLRCRDYGGKTTVNIYRGDVLLTSLEVPEDKDHDLIADAWEKQHYGKLSAIKHVDHDLENKWGQKSMKDGLNAFNEYRGYLLHGGTGHRGGHKRLSPLRKEVLLEIDRMSGVTHMPGDGELHQLLEGTTSLFNSADIDMYYFLDQKGLNHDLFPEGWSALKGYADAVKANEPLELNEFHHIILADELTGTSYGLNVVEGLSVIEGSGVAMFLFLDKMMENPQYPLGGDVTFESTFKYILAHEFMHTIIDTRDKNGFDFYEHVVLPGPAALMYHQATYFNRSLPFISEQTKSQIDLAGSMPR